MASISAFSSPYVKISIATLVLILCSCSNFCDASASFPPRVFNVINYGARADGHSDNSKAFLKAWKDACEFRGRSRVLIPPGIYMLNSVTFTGPCRGKMVFLIKGTLMAPTNPMFFFTPTWIGFRYIDNLALKGGGFLNGQGRYAWKHNDCARNSHCKPLPATLRFDFVSNSTIKYLRSIDSKKEHISLFACNNIDISFIRITAPEYSLNTDGIHIGNSKNIKISRAVIGTGDDCISMVSGSQNIDISQVVCGPGHGISIGSLGRGIWQEHVTGINVVNSTFKNTQNGVRIKTWSPSDFSLAANINFQDIRMENVNNPIFIDQDYCPFCGSRKIGESLSRVQIRNATFKNIWGTSSSKAAISLHCSKLKPCKEVKLVDINLVYKGTRRGGGGPAVASCFNVLGVAYGKQVPSGCL